MLTIFLDIDGVLNTCLTVERSYKGYTGIDSLRVETLAKAINKFGGASIVLTSDWKDISNKEKDLDYLSDKLAEYNLLFSDKAPNCRHERGLSIIKYLEAHPDIDEFVVLDDNTYEFKDYKKSGKDLFLQMA